MYLIASLFVVISMSFAFREWTIDWFGKFMWLLSYAGLLMFIDFAWGRLTKINIIGDFCVPLVLFIFMIIPLPRRRPS